MTAKLTDWDNHFRRLCKSKNSRFCRYCHSEAEICYDDIDKSVNKTINLSPESLILKLLESEHRYHHKFMARHLVQLDMINCLQLKLKL